MAKVAIIIPHWKGEGLLSGCLQSLQKTAYSDYEIIVVNNGCPDSSINEAEGFSKTTIVSSTKNLGYAGGCNFGVQHSQSEFIVLLNNDTEVVPGWLEKLIEIAENNPDIGAVQPKILNYYQRDKFDYCGAAGGALDIFGYPFAHGRLFETTEPDTGQYDSVRQIFWASGAAALFRRTAFESSGFLEEDFFAHMEEIDLCWRMHWAGWKIVSCPEAVIYHQTGSTLDSESYRKMLLNHRNSLLMVMRNTPFPAIIWIGLLRLLLEFLTLLMSLFTGKFKRAGAVIIGFFAMLSMCRTILRGRRYNRRHRKITSSDMFAKLYPGSSALEYYSGRRKITDLIFYNRIKGE